MQSFELFGAEWISHAGLYAYGSVSAVEGTQGFASTTHGATAQINVNGLFTNVDLDVADAVEFVSIAEYGGTQSIFSTVRGWATWPEFE